MNEGNEFKIEKIERQRISSNTFFIIFEKITENIGRNIRKSLSDFYENKRREKRNKKIFLFFVYKEFV